MRVHILAKELNVSSKTIIDKCKAEGINTVKNHMSTLSAGLHATIIEWFSEGQHATALETAEPIDLKKVRIRRRPKSDTTAATETGRPGDDEHEDSGVATEALEEGYDADAGDTGQVESVDDELTAVAEEETAVAAAETAETMLATEQPATGGEQPAALQPTAAAATPPESTRRAPAEVEDSEPTGIEESAPAKAKPRKPVVPAGPQNVPTAAKLQGPRVVRYETPDHDVAPRRRPVGIVPRAGELRPPGGPGIPPTDAGKAPEKDAGRRKGRFNTRRGTGRVAESGEQLSEWRDRDLLERKERLAGATGRRIHRRRSPTTGSTPSTEPAEKTSATVHEPVRMKEFCGATGLNFIQLFKVLRDQYGIMGNVNMTIPTETAQLLALHHGIELDVVRARTSLDELQEEFANRERNNLTPRPPVVTMLGHVDHGKTSLLDAIRKTNVADAEDGGITQHIGAYHIKTPRGPVTFLDTPGHEAFAEMRARGAQMTDVVVLVVAADDGIMPQTVEAIRHAQAAQVPIVVALNKIDLGDQNKLKIFGQLTEHGLTPSGEWGGEVDVIPTSATTGEGIPQLVEHLADLSSLLELKADSTLSALGTVIEAAMKPGVGPIVHVLVQEGTLHIGEFVVCGNAFGKIRALLGDRGKRIDSAGPGIPVEIWGLDDVPMAGDRIYCVSNTQRAKNIASETKRLRVETGRLHTRKVKSLEEMFQRRGTEELPELNVIIKTDVDGSLAALRQALGEIPSDEVRMTIRHAAVGAVNDSDILLAATCDGVIVAFRVDVSAGARRMAEEHGVDVRPYRVIYDVCDEIRKALSGMLTPEERIESRAAAQVRQMFRVTKIGAVAGCYISQGPLERNQLAKVVRDGVVIRQDCKIASLRHLKDDVREVRSGMECGIRLEGFDDVHVGDVIETYEVIKIARTL
jgi:translation initiation factor IF-2